MEKIEASLIKRLMRINWQGFNSFLVELSSILTLSYSLTLRVFLEHSWRVAYLDAWSKKTKENKESPRGHRDQQLQWSFLAGTELHVYFPL